MSKSSSAANVLPSGKSQRRNLVIWTTASCGRKKGVVLMGAIAISNSVNRGKLPEAPPHGHLALNFLCWGLGIGVGEGELSKS